MLIDEYLRARIEAVKAQLEREGYQPESEEVKPVGPDVPVDFRESRPVFVPVMGSQLEALCDVAKAAREHWNYSGECSSGDITGCDLCEAMAKLEDPNLPEPEVRKPAEVKPGKPERRTYSKSLLEADMRVTIGEPEDDGRIRMTIDSIDPGVHAVLVANGWALEQ
jgi:hypothetical protein